MNEKFPCASAVSKKKSTHSWARLSKETVIFLDHLQFTKICSQCLGNLRNQTNTLLAHLFTNYYTQLSEIKQWKRTFLDHLQFTKTLHPVMTVLAFERYFLWASAITIKAVHCQANLSILRVFSLSNCISKQITVCKANLGFWMGTFLNHLQFKKTLHPVETTKSFERIIVLSICKVQKSLHTLSQP